MGPPHDNCRIGVQTIKIKNKNKREINLAYSSACVVGSQGRCFRRWPNWALLVVKFERSLHGTR